MFAFDFSQNDNPELTLEGEETEQEISESGDSVSMLRIME